MEDNLKCLKCLNYLNYHMCRPNLCSNRRGAGTSRSSNTFQSLSHSPKNSSSLHRRLLLSSRRANRT